MTEHMGPNEAECPAAILDLLTSTDAEFAVAWRRRCRDALAARTNRPRLRNGWTLVFEEPVKFSDSAEHRRLQVAIDARRPRAVRFRSEQGHGLYRIGRLDALRFTVEPNA